MTDEATYRLGTILAVVAGVQFVAKLLGLGVGNGWRFDILALIITGWPCRCATASCGRGRS